MTDIMDIPDERLRSFLDSLEDADFEVSDFEADFMETNMKRNVFTERQRLKVLNRMVARYGDRVAW